MDYTGEPPMSLSHRPKCPECGLMKEIIGEHVCFDISHLFAPEEKIRAKVKGDPAMSKETLDAIVEMLRLAARMADDEPA